MSLASSAVAVSYLAVGGDRDLNAILDFAPGATIWTIIAFVVALPLMWKFVYGPITTALEERDKKAEDAIVAAATAQKKAEEQMAQARQELQAAQANAKRMVEEAMARAERQAAEALRIADEKSKAELQKARDTIAAEKRQALLEIRQEVVNLTIAATGKLLQKQVDDAQNRQLVQQFVAASGAEGGGGRR